MFVVELIVQGGASLHGSSGHVGGGSRARVCLCGARLRSRNRGGVDGGASLNGDGGRVGGGGRIVGG